MTSAPTQPIGNLRATQVLIVTCPLCTTKMKPSTTVPNQVTCSTCGLTDNRQKLSTNSGRTSAERRQLQELQHDVAQGKKAEQILRTINRPLQ